MILTIDLIKTRFLEYNKLYFDNKLDITNVKFSLRKLKRVIASVRVGKTFLPNIDYINGMFRVDVINSPFKYFIKEVKFSSQAKLTEEEFSKVLLHEMVHFKIYQIDQKAHTHDKLFRSECKKISKLSGYENIHPARTKLSNTMGTIFVPLYAFVIADSTNIRKAIIFTPNKAKNIMSIRKMLMIQFSGLIYKEGLCQPKTKFKVSLTKPSFYKYDESHLKWL